MPKITPLYEAHLAHHAQMVDFAGTLLPVRFQGEIKEHCAVREKAGLFDISHMGEIWVEGPKAEDFLNRVLSNDSSLLKTQEAHYTLLLNPKAGVIDDLILYRLGTQEFMLCVNASNREKDFHTLKERLVQFQMGETVKITDRSADYALIALQGPEVVSIVGRLSPQESLPSRFHIEPLALKKGPSQIEVLAARTGYTGEDGFELFVRSESALALWNLLLAEGVLPCGLAARDTLRLEAGMCLHGHDIDENTTPLEAGLMFAVALNKTTPFVGQEALLKQIKVGPEKKRVGIRLLGKGIARESYPLFSEEGQPIGKVTSGSLPPTQKTSIAMGYVASPFAKLGQKVLVGIRNNQVPAEIVKMPFIKKP